ncbi:MAG: NAD(P)/FAD-dependent oxidoreductase [archaeon]|nr:NAD(P)/FAD-dependent oxidoreductase [archaeon]
MTENSNFYNFIIVGSGPAGLSASIVAARKGLKVIVLEKGEIAGPRPRGEGMRFFPILDELLGEEGKFKSFCFENNGNSIFHSPGALHPAHVNRDSPSYFFDWRDLIDGFVKSANESGVTFLYNSEVTEPIEKDGVCIGVKYKDNDGNVNEIFGNTILACDGHKSAIGNYYKVPYETMNCPMVKCRVSNANIDITKTLDLQFFMIANGELDYAPFFPQSFSYIFPIGDRNLEIGLMLRMTQVPKMKKTVKIPTEDEIWKVWERLKKEQAGFSDFLKGAKIEHEEITGLSNVGMVKNFIPAPGVVLIGDSAGMVDPFGSSGLIYSMESGKTWVEAISKKLIEIGGGTDVSESLVGLWSSENAFLFDSEFRDSWVFKKIKKSYSLISKFEWFIFRFLRTPKKINKRWNIINKLLNLA